MKEKKMAMASELGVAARPMPDASKEVIQVASQVDTLNAQTQQVLSELMFKRDQLNADLRLVNIEVDRCRAALEGFNPNMNRPKQG